MNQNPSFIHRGLAMLLAFGVTMVQADVESTPIEQLGKKLFFDAISEPASQSCASCHSSKAGWTGPIAGINIHGAVYRGAQRQRFGNRKPPTSANSIRTRPPVTASHRPQPIQRPDVTTSEIL